MLMISVLVLALPLASATGQVSGTPEATPTPVVGSASGQQPTPPQQQTQQQSEPATQQQQTSGPVEAPSESDTADPVIAQGLIYLTGDDVVWQVRDVDIAEPSTVTGNARVILQRSGETVIRNDLTGKRTRLEPGEAYFASAGDPYTTFPDGNTPSEVWTFEVSNSNEVGEGAFYLSPDVSGYGEAVYDYEFTRHTTTPGNPATIAAGDGPSMVMVLAGQVNVTDENGTASLTTRDGLIVNGDATVESTSGEAVVVSMTIGPRVSDESSAPPAAAQTPAEDVTTTDSDATGEETTQPVESAPPAEPSGESGAYLTSIRVGAAESIGVTLYADGVLMFDGWLEPGEWTAFYDGSYFEVYTTSGENTMFENSCGGEPFFMGYETGDAYYQLEAGPSSCAPVGG
ncbi:MAG TPA: hypothetical protein VGR22_02775 [Thermomicrobiales bacterium]|nr:hypothetical protein [Thermomicrobiales bacterium]